MMEATGGGGGADVTGESRFGGGRGILVIRKRENEGGGIVYSGGRATAEVSVVGVVGFCVCFRLFLSLCHGFDVCLRQRRENREKKLEEDQV